MSITEAEKQALLNDLNAGGNGLSKDAKNTLEKVINSIVTEINNVSENAGSGGSGESGPITQFRRWSVPLAFFKTQDTPLLNLGTFPAGYYMANLNLRLAANTTSVNSVYFGNSSRVTYHNGQEVGINGVNSNHTGTVVFQLTGESEVILHTSYANVAETIMCFGGVVDVFKLENPASEWV